MQNTAQKLIIYHGNCADGFGAAWCFWKVYGSSAEYYPGVYQKSPPSCVGKDVFLVDFSYKRHIVEEIIKEAASVTLIDHHKTALEDLQGLPNLKYFCSLEHSGAVLAWKFLFGDIDPPLLLGHIEDRDLWKFKLPNTREIQANVFSYPYDFETWDTMMKADQTELLKMTVAGAAIERKHFKDIRELLKEVTRPMCIGNHIVPVASLPYTMVSDAATILAENHPFAACYHDTATDRCFGLRSVEGGMDVSKIALMYGGGGHPRSSGFKVPREHILARS